MEHSIQTHCPSAPSHWFANYEQLQEEFHDYLFHSYISLFKMHLLQSPLSLPSPPHEYLFDNHMLLIQ